MEEVLAVVGGGVAEALKNDDDDDEGGGGGSVVLPDETARLCPELLACVFSYFDGNVASLHVIMVVCRRWYAVVVSLPRRVILRYPVMWEMSSRAEKLKILDGFVGRRSERAKYEVTLDYACTPPPATYELVPNIVGCRIATYSIWTCAPMSLEWFAAYVSVTLRKFVCCRVCLQFNTTESMLLPIARNCKGLEVFVVTDVDYFDDGGELLRELAKNCPRLRRMHFPVLLDDDVMIPSAGDMADFCATYETQLTECTVQLNAVGLHHDIHYNSAAVPLVLGLGALKTLRIARKCTLAGRFDSYPFLPTSTAHLETLYLSGPCTMTDRACAAEQFYPALHMLQLHNDAVVVWDFTRYHTPNLRVLEIVDSECLPNTHLECIQETCVALEEFTMFSCEGVSTAHIIDGLKNPAVWPKLRRLQMYDTEPMSCGRQIAEYLDSGRPELHFTWIHQEDYDGSYDSQIKQWGYTYGDMRSGSRWDVWAHRPPNYTDQFIDLEYPPPTV